MNKSRQMVGRDPWTGMYILTHIFDSEEFSMGKHLNKAERDRASLKK
jgi:hypothetical protein